MSLAKIGVNTMQSCQIDLVRFAKESYQHFWIMELPQPYKEGLDESGIEDYTMSKAGH